MKQYKGSEPVDLPLEIRDGLRDAEYFLKRRGHPIYLHLSRIQTERIRAQWSAAMSKGIQQRKEYEAEKLIYEVFFTKQRKQYSRAVTRGAYGR